MFLNLGLQLQRFLQQIPIRNISPCRIDPPIIRPFEPPLRHAPVRIFRISGNGHLHEGHTRHLIVSIDGLLQSDDDGGDFGRLVRRPWVRRETARPGLRTTPFLVDDAGSGGGGVAVAVVAAGAVDAHFHDVDHVCRCAFDLSLCCQTRVGKEERLADCFEGRQERYPTFV